MAAIVIEATEDDTVALLRLELRIETIATFAHRGSLPARAALERIAAGAWPAEQARRELAAANLDVLRRLSKREGARA